ncbi:MAG: STN domain-containing protein [Planctomycetes bacterium]|nr:STN domain-containing protein [Planctomycetota bacterium]
MHHTVRVGTALLAAFALSGPAVARAQGREDAARDTRRQEIVAKLDSMKVSLDFEKTPLVEVIDFVRSLSDINFVIDKRVRDAHPDDPLEITLKVDNLSLRSALKLVLSMHDLTAKYKEGVLLVVPKDDASDEDLVTRLYDVRDLLMSLPDFPGPDIELKPPDDSGNTGTTGLSEPPPTPPMEPDFIVEMIQKNTGGDSWEKNPKCTATLNNGLLVVCQSPEIHKEILKLLSMLRSNR